ncbi:hypothetical protein PUN28_018725 [Cardiocondyla obscurior]|uniref:Secreted protein n=1 Tax=Cardiocondyla obscurior TaxID=286306 RepID=A0AAW2EFM6_9HYME
MLSRRLSSETRQFFLRYFYLCAGRMCAYSQRGTNSSRTRAHPRGRQAPPRLCPRACVRAIIRERNKGEKKKKKRDADVMQQCALRVQQACRYLSCI